MINAAHAVLEPGQPTIDMLQKSSLTGAVQLEIERLIHSGELAPGDKLTEIALAERLGVSRGPVREAFRVLEEAGLVQLEKNRGVFVREVSLQEALEIFDLRAMMEAHVGATLAVRASAVQIQALQGLIDSMEQAVHLHDDALYHVLNVEFHENMVSFAGNQKLISIYRRLTRELGLFRRRNLTQHALLLASIQEHRDILA
ncbi:MAG: GntR family transcriptional regulator, partial [Betaproteobacteria bacterium]|nr:GntR family transcriptional regulator [Betaproteobacteria bacterium]